MVSPVFLPLRLDFFMIVKLIASLNFRDAPIIPFLGDFKGSDKEKKRQVPYGTCLSTVFFKKSLFHMLFKFFLRFFIGFFFFFLPLITRFVVVFSRYDLVLNFQIFIVEGLTLVACPSKGCRVWYSLTNDWRSSI